MFNAYIEHVEKIGDAYKLRINIGAYLTAHNF
jgi:hypothetical protein